MAEQPAHEALTRRISELERALEGCWEREKDLRARMHAAENGAPADLSRQKETEALLRDSQERLQALSDGSFEAIFLSRDGICLDQNETARKMFGYSHAEAIGRHGAEWIAPEDRERVRMHMRSGHEKPYEVTALRKDGTRFPAEIQARMITYQGCPVRVTVLRDITERKKAEAALRDSEKRFALALRGSNDGIWDWDRATDAVFYSRRWKEIIGYADHEIRHDLAEWTSRIHPDDREAVLTVNNSFYENDATHFEVEYRLRHRDGSYRWILGRGTCLRDSGGVPYRMSGAHTDITKRKEVEAALEESRQRYKSLYSLLRLMCDNVPDLIWAKDLEKRYLFANSAICRQLLNTPDTREPLGRTDLFFAERERAAHREDPLWHTFGEICVDSDAVVMESRRAGRFDEYGNALGRYLHLDVHKAPFYDENGTLIGTVGCGRDVTKEKQIENQLRMAHKMEAIGTLAGGIAHDFNNILSIILGNTELAIDDTPAWNPVRESLNEIWTAAMRAKEIVRQILTYSRKTDQERMPVNVRTIVRETVKLLRSTIPKRIEIQESVPDGEITILLDPTQVNQILINLATNAVHAMPEGGSLGIQLEEVALDSGLCSRYGAVEPGRYVRITVADTGHGIPAGLLDRVFDPYFTTKDVDQGTGMGLAIVHGIVTNNAGGVHLSSTPGVGTTVEIVFPVVDMDRFYGQTTARPATPSGCERILLVDDETSILRYQTQQLKRLGYDVASESDPIAALARIRAASDRFDLVITDMSMPKMDGDRLVREIHAIRADLPVILYTGYSEKMDEVRAAGIGAALYMEKPLTREKLAAAIRSLLDRPDSDK